MADTASTVIKESLQKLGVLGAGDALPGDHADDALAVLNALAEAWTAERLLSYVLRESSAAWAAAVTSKTVAASGADIPAARPVKVLTAIWRDAASLDTPL